MCQGVFGAQIHQLSLSLSVPANGDRPSFSKVIKNLYSWKYRQDSEGAFGDFFFQPYDAMLIVPCGKVMRSVRIGLHSEEDA